MEELVIRPGRSLIAWTKESATRVSVTVESEIAVSVFIETPTGCLKASPAARRHELAAHVDKPGRLSVRVQNASGTRKARINFEAHNG